jgi:hypothetical protein
MKPQQAILSRCLDCSMAFKCSLDCPLFDLMDTTAIVDWTGMLLRYCQWCRTRNQVNQCTGSECAIYQYRMTTKENEDCKTVNDNRRII